MEIPQRFWITRSSVVSYNKKLNTFFSYVLMYYSLYPLPLVLPAVTPEEPGSVLFILPHQVFIPLTLLQAEQSQLSQAFLIEETLQTLQSSLRSSVRLSSMSMSLMYWEVQKQTQYCRCGLTSGEQGGKDHLLDLLVILFLMNLGHLWPYSLQTHYWFFYIFSTRSPRSFSPKLLFSWLDPSTCWSLGLFLPRSRTWCFPLPNLMRFPSVNFSSLLRSVWMAAQPSGLSTTPQFCILCKLAEGVPLCNHLGQ